MPFNKKGDLGENSVAYLIIGVATLVVLGSILYVVFVEREDVFTTNICRMSVYLSDQSLGIFSKLGFKSILCKTYHKEIDENEEEKFLKKIAESMEMCWWMWGEGNNDPNGENLLKWRENKCFVCYKLETPAEVPEITLKGFKDYLENPDNREEKISYWNYFVGDKNKVIFNFPNLKDQNNPLFKKNEFYAVAYVNDVRENFIANIVKGAAFGTTLGAGACVLTGVGIVLSPLCVAAGAVVGTGVMITKDTIESHFYPKSDGIMIAEFGAVENVCSSELK
ncbi:hypothetical protein HYV89_03180 [Candidatus Woesearchaeota archaeon]|nr:hypothetical protein [Candidatus Woesearchaeota archaeon]